MDRRPTPLEMYLAQALALHGRHSDWCANSQRLIRDKVCRCGYADALETANLVVEMVVRMGVEDDDA